VEFDTGLSLTAAVMPNVDITPFHLGEGEDEWEHRIRIDPERAPELVVLPDPLSCNPQHLVDWLDECFPDSTKIGGLASAAVQPGGNALFLGDTVHRAGAVGIALTGDVELDTLVAQGCRPVGTPMFVTRSSGNIVLELDGTPAVKVLESLYAQLSRGDQQLFRSSLFLGLVMRDDLEVYDRGDFLIRNLIGVDVARSAIAIAAVPRANQVVQFHLRDANTSREDLAHILTRHSHATPSGALLFSCTGRGRGLYGKPDHDTSMFHDVLGPVPLGGFFCAGEIGPVHGQTFLHGYTSSFGLFRAKHAPTTDADS
jgi:small ligand-binding sensory domain FIST